MMDWLTNNLAQSLLVIGLLLLVIEIVVLGFSTFVLFFVGIAAVISSILLFLGIIPDTVLSALLSTGIITAISAVVLWKPLKNLQTKVDNTKAKSDLVGHTFVLAEAVTPDFQPKYRYSGIEWKLVSTESLAAGTRVEVIEVDVGVFHIKTEG